MEENMKKQIEDSEKQIQTMKKTYEEKLSEAQAKVMSYINFIKIKFLQNSLGKRNCKI